MPVYPWPGLDEWSPEIFSSTTNYVVNNSSNDGKSAVLPSSLIQYDNTEILPGANEAVTFTAFASDNPWRAIIQFKP